MLFIIRTDAGIVIIVTGMLFHSVSRYCTFCRNLPIATAAHILMPYDPQITRVKLLLPLPCRAPYFYKEIILFMNMLFEPTVDVCLVCVSVVSRNAAYDRGGAYLHR